MRSSSSSSISGLPAKRSKPNPRTPVQRSPFINFGSYMGEKNRKLRSQFEAEASSSILLNSEPTSSGDDKGIFHGISIFVDGHTVPSSQELRGYMLRHGGRFENYFSRSRVSHIICSNLSTSKLRNIRAFSRGLPVLKPAWIVDSVAANSLLSWSPYQLVEHSSEIYKQQKLSAFFGCKTISSFKAAVAFDSNKEIEPEGLVESKGSPFPLQSKDFYKVIKVNERIELGVDKDAKFTTLLDERTKVEASNSTSTQLSIPTSSHIDDVSVDDVSSGEPTNVKFLQAYDVQHSTLTDPNFVENYFKVLGGTTLKPEASYTSGSTSCELNHPKKAECCLDKSEGANLDKSAPQGVISHSASVSGAGDTLGKFPNHIESEWSLKSKINLWSGSPPKWVEKFEVSEYLILNLIAQLYTKFGAGLFSPILQSLISLYPLILGSSSDGPAEPRLDLCELLLQYIDHKIDSDIEELYLCCRLLERLTTMSNFFSEVYCSFLSPLQVSVNENYGGTLQLTGSGD